VNKKQVVKEALLKFAEDADKLDGDMFRERVIALTEQLHGIAKPPMPGWKKKAYAVVLTLAGLWGLVQYLHYEACREKFPTASGWVCVMQSR